MELRRFEAFGNQVQDVAALNARYCDLVVAARPDGKTLSVRDDLIEGALLGGGRPVLAAPPGWSEGAVGERIVLAWDASREASRAANDMTALAAPGAHVCVAMVDPQAGRMGHGEAPGQELAAHLARHGLQVELRAVDSLGRSAADALHQTALDFGADLLAMGGYRHARVRQALFGGATRTLLRTCTTPLLLSH